MSYPTMSYPTMSYPTMSYPTMSYPTLESNVLSNKQLYKSDNHYQDWIDAIKKRTKPVSDVETGHRTASLCNIANIAYELQRPLKWDPKKEHFNGDGAANMMLSRAYRGKWNFHDF